MRKLTFLFLISILIASCSKNDDDDASLSIHKKFLVSKVFDYQDRLLAEYFYNENNQLIKRAFTDPSTVTSSDLVFNYQNNKLSEVQFFDNDNPGFNYNRLFFYNTSHRMVRSEVYKNENILSHINYAYTTNGQLDHFFKDDGSTFNFYEYDNHGNIITVTNCCYIDQISGDAIEQIRSFTYDNHKKPSFNLDYLFQINLLPKMGDEEMFERNISCNNLTSFENSGTKWIYEYNENGLPIAILTEWYDLPTEEPMIIKIVYKEV